MTTATNGPSAEPLTTARANVIEAARERRKREAATTADDVLTWLADHLDYYRHRDGPLHALALVVKHHGTEPVRWTLATTGSSALLAETFRRAEREHRAWMDQGRANVPVHSSSLVVGDHSRRRAAGAEGFDLEAAA